MRRLVAVVRSERAAVAELAGGVRSVWVEADRAVKALRLETHRALQAQAVRLRELERRVADSASDGRAVAPTAQRRGAR